jgi:hypothetical protein
LNRHQRRKYGHIGEPRPPKQVRWQLYVVAVVLAVVVLYVRVFVLGRH